MSTSVIISTIALTFAFITSVCITVLVSKALSRAFSTINSMHIRSQASLDKTLDRLMTIRWEDFVSTRSMQEEGEEGGFFTPEEQGNESSVTIVEPGRWGALSQLNDRLEALDNENKLLDEDFPDERQAG